MIYKIIIIGLYTLALGVNLAKHGEPKKGKYNFFYSLSAYIIVAILIYLI